MDLKISRCVSAVNVSDVGGLPTAVITTLNILQSVGRPGEKSACDTALDFTF